MINEKSILYLAGPMRGYPNNNFDAFDAAEARARLRGFDTIFNPATVDRNDPCPVVQGFLARGSFLDEVEKAYLCRKFALADTRKVFESTHIAMLKGWEDSVGANAEFALAKWLGISILDAEDFIELDPTYYHYSTKTTYPNEELQWLQKETNGRTITK
jgi:hypothetical protein